MQLKLEIGWCLHLPALLIYRLEMFVHSSFKNSSKIVRVDGEHLCVSIVIFGSRLLFRFTSVCWLCFIHLPCPSWIKASAQHDALSTIFVTGVMMMMGVVSFQHQLFKYKFLELIVAMPADSPPDLWISARSLTTQDRKIFLVCSWTIFFQFSDDLYNIAVLLIWTFLTRVSCAGFCFEMWEERGCLQM